ARALVDLVDLDFGRVLLLHQDNWKARAVQTSTRAILDEPTTPSRHVLGRVLREKRTFWEVPEPAAGDATSLRGVEAVVAAPTRAPRGEVIAAFYGDRRAGGPGETITEPEAMLVEVLARGVAAGLARLEQEQATLAARVQLEQFFTPELSRHLARQP